jgi:hypothetical protein
MVLGWRSLCALDNIGSEQHAHTGTAMIFSKRTASTSRYIFTPSDYLGDIIRVQANMTLLLSSVFMKISAGPAEHLGDWKDLDLASS